jgi:hypothetical protein
LILRVLELKTLSFSKSVSNSEQAKKRKIMPETSTCEDFQILEEGTDCGTRTGNVGKDGCGY